MKVYVLLVVLIISTETNCQVLSDWEMRSENYYHRIKNIEFFIDRFNHQPEGSGKIIEVDKKDTSTYLNWLKERDAVIFSLFDKQRLHKEGIAYISKEWFNDFIRQVNNPYQSQFLHFSDSNWYATLVFEAIHQTKPVDVEVSLKVNHSREGAYTWVITKVYSRELALDENFNNQLHFIPSVHGTDFMGVRLALSDPGWTKQIRQGDRDIPTRFLDLLASKELKLSQINLITYHFLQLEDWILSVRYVNRESSNSGWLVNSLIKASDEEKNSYLVKNRIN